MTGPCLAQAAEALVGAPFRLHGRDPLTGLDCVGVVTTALAACGKLLRDPSGYAMRNRSIAPLLTLAEKNGLVAVDDRVTPGDIVLVRAGAGQHHLLIAIEPDRFVHAHAGLRRVVAQPGPLPWPVERRWRIQSEDT